MHNTTSRCSINRQGISYFGETALCSAASRNRIEVVKTLLEFEADVEKGNIYGNTPLMIAAERGNIHIVNILLEAKANVNPQSHYGQTALKYAVQYPEIIKVLLDAKADVNVKDCDGNTALIRAALLNETKTVKLFLEAKADPNVKFVSNFWLILFLPHPDDQKMSVLSARVYDMVSCLWYSVGRQSDYSVKDDLYDEPI